MSTLWTLIMGDDDPLLPLTITEDDVAVDISTWTLAVQVDIDKDGDNIVEAAGTIVSGPAGTVTFDFSGVDWDDTPAGVYSIRVRRQVSSRWLTLDSTDLKIRLKDAWST